MKFDRIYTRITGLSCPIFGIQWTPPSSESKTAEDVVSFLEDKRVLYNPVDIEDARHCLLSVIDIREHLTRSITQTGSGKPLNAASRRMRKACREFCDKIGSPSFDTLDSPVQKSLLDRALYSLRTDFGKAIAELSVAYGLDIEDDLASIIPFNNT